MVIGLVILAVALSLIPWSGRSHAKDDPEYDDFLTNESYEPDAQTGTIRTTKEAGHYNASVSTSMIIAMVTVWGGLIAAIVNLVGVPPVVRDGVGTAHRALKRVCQPP